MGSPPDDFTAFRLWGRARLVSAALVGCSVSRLVATDAAAEAADVNSQVSREVMDVREVLFVEPREERLNLQGRGRVVEGMVRSKLEAVFIGAIAPLDLSFHRLDGHFGIGPTF